MAEAERASRDLQSFEIILLPGFEEGFRSATYHTAEHKHFRVSNIIVPCANNHPKCSGVRSFKTRKDAYEIEKRYSDAIFPPSYKIDEPFGYYAWGATWQMIHKGNYIQTIRARPEARKWGRSWLKKECGDKKPIVITLREHHYQPERNSDIRETTAFLSSLDAGEYAPVIIRDHEASLGEVPEEIQQFTICPFAPWNIDFRTALYELAYIAMFINNGPWLLGVLNDAVNCVVTKLATDEVAVSSRKWLSEQGFIPDQKPSFLGPHQTVLWNRDRQTNLQHGFDEVKAALDTLVCDEFDPAWYARKYDAPAGSSDDYIFKLYQGRVKTERQNPNDWFDENWYLEQHPELVGEIEDGLFDSGFDHFVKNGRRRGYLPSLAATEKAILDQKHDAVQVRV